MQRHVRSGGVGGDRGQVPFDDPELEAAPRFLPGSSRLYQKASFIGTVLDDIGLPRPEPQDVDDFALEISAASPLWQRLSGVQSGDVHAMPDDHWMLGIGIGAANLVLDDIESLLLGA